jgi:hypothetical protein
MSTSKPLGGWPTLSPPFYSVACPVQAPLGRGLFVTPLCYVLSGKRLTSDLAETKETRRSGETNARVRRIHS